MTTQTEIQILIEALKMQIEKPARAIVNSESAFVVNRLHRMDQVDLAKKYWNWICGYPRQPLFFGEEVDALQAQLDVISKKSSMPAWGTYGS